MCVPGRGRRPGAGCGMIRTAVEPRVTYTFVHGTSARQFTRDPLKTLKRPAPTSHPAGTPATGAATRLRAQRATVWRAGVNRGSQLTRLRVVPVWLGCPTFDWVVPGADHPTLGQDVPNFTGPSQPCMGAMSHMAGLSQNVQSSDRTAQPAGGTSHANLGRPTFSDGQLLADTPARIAE